MRTEAQTPGRVFHTLLGVVALAFFAGAVWVTWVFLSGGFQTGVPVRAVFSAPGVGQQLPVGGDVKVRGVLVGRIADLTLDGDTAVIEMLLDEDLELPAPVSAEIRSKTVFGQKWVELLPGGGPKATVRSGHEIPDELTTEPLELERALQLGHELLSEIPMKDLAEVFGSLAEGFSGSEQDARRAMDRGLVALRSVNSRSSEFDLSLRQLNEFSEWLDENDDALLSFMSSLDSANRALVGAAPELRSNLQSVPGFFADLARLQEDTERDLGRLVEDGATVLELLASRADDINAFVVNLRPFTTVWNSGLSQPCGGLYEQDLTCWQLYQPPGLESRGLYRRGEAPHEDEPGDPGFKGRSFEEPLMTAEEILARGIGAGTLSDLERLLRAPLDHASGGRS